MDIELVCGLCKIEIKLPLQQFRDNRDGGFSLSNLKCINCQTVLKAVDLWYDVGEL